MKALVTTWLCMGILLGLTACTSESQEESSPDDGEDALQSCLFDQECQTGMRCDTDGYCKPEDEVAACPVYQLRCADDGNVEKCMPGEDGNAWTLELECPFGCENALCLPDPGDDDDDNSSDDDDDNTHPVLCQECQADRDCNSTDAVCIPKGSGGYCATSCAQTFTCPEGYACQLYADLSGDEHQLCMPPSNSCREESCLMTGCMEGFLCNTSTEVCEASAELGDKTYCEACSNHEQCGRAIDLCLNDDSGEGFCAPRCTEDEDCPEGGRCDEVSGQSGSYCRPPLGLCEPTRCTGVECPPRQTCNEETGWCEESGNHCALTGCPGMFECNLQTGECEMEDDHCENTGCDEGFHCDYQSGICEPGGDPSDGDATDGDVTDGDVTDGDVTDGDEEDYYCHPCLSQNECGTGGACLENSLTYEAYCVTPCETHNDCPSGAGCNTELVAGRGFCVPNLNACTGYSYPGGNCSDPNLCDTCAQGSTLCNPACLQDFGYTGDVWWQGGYCTAVCQSNDDCAYEAVCMNFEYQTGSMENLCLRSCTDHLDCHTGQVCCYGPDVQGNNVGVCVAEGFYCQ